MADAKKTPAVEIPVSPEVKRRLKALIQVDVLDFRAMAEASGLDPKTDFRHTRWRNLDFGGSNLDGFDFTGADLRGSDFSRAKTDGAKLDKALTEGARGLEGVGIKGDAEYHPPPPLWGEAEWGTTGWAEDAAPAVTTYLMGAPEDEAFTERLTADLRAAGIRVERCSDTPAHMAPSDHFVAAVTARVPFWLRRPGFDRDVILIRRAPGLPAEPAAAMVDLFDGTYDDRLPHLIEILRRPATPFGPLLGVPEGGDDGLPEPLAFDVIDHLMRRDDSRVAILHDPKHDDAVRALAIGLARHPGVRRHFVDGVVWIEGGSDLPASLMASVQEAPSLAGKELQDVFHWLAQARVLLVINGHAKPSHVVGFPKPAHGATLLTYADIDLFLEAEFFVYDPEQLSLGMVPRRELLERLDGIRAGTDLDMLEILAARARKEGAARWGDVDWRRLDIYGRDIAEAAREGFKAFWPRHYPPVASDGSVPRDVPIGLLGLAAAVADGLDFGQLDLAKATMAALFGLQERIGSADWMPALAQSNMEAVTVALDVLLANAWEGKGVPHYLRADGGSLRRLVAGMALDRLEGRAPVNAGVLAVVIQQILAAVTYDFGSMRRLARICEKISTKAPSSAFRRAALCGWLWIDAQAAWQAAPKDDSSELLILLGELYHWDALVNEIKADYMRPDVARYLLGEVEKVIPAHSDPDMAEKGHAESERDMVTYFRRRLAAAARVAQALDKAVELERLGDQALAENDQAEASNLYALAVSALRDHLGDDYPQVLRLLLKLATSMRADAKPPMLFDLVASFERVFGQDHADTLTAKFLLAEALFQAGELHRAEAAFGDVVHGRQRVLASDHPDTLRAKRRLAQSMLARGQAGKAIPALTAVLSAKQKALGRDHPDRLDAMNELALANYGHGNFDRATDLFGRIYKIYRRTSGEDSASSLAALSNLGLAEAGRHHFPAAITALEKSLDGRRRTLGPTHPDTLATLRDLASVLQRSGDEAAARALLEEGLPLAQDALGPNHPTSIRIATALANLSTTPPGAKP